MSNGLFSQEPLLNKLFILLERDFEEFKVSLTLLSLSSVTCILRLKWHDIQ